MPDWRSWKQRKRKADPENKLQKCEEMRRFEAEWKPNQKENGNSKKTETKRKQKPKEYKGIQRNTGSGTKSEAGEDMKSRSGMESEAGEDMETRSKKERILAGIEGFKAYGEDGQCENCFVISAVRDDETDRFYMLYVVEEELGKGSFTDVYAGIFEPEELDMETGMLELRPVETEREWQMLSKVLDEVMSA